MVDIPRTLGALLVGGLVAFLFSGILTVQCFTYFKYYPTDPRWTRTLVSAVWTLDLCHTVLIGISLWDYLILHFGQPERVDYIAWSIPITIAATATLTFLVHCFSVHRIYKISNKNLLIAIPLGCMACLRLCFALFTTTKMITLRSLESFVAGYTWSFTMGLAISSSLDILITGFLCFTLLAGRKKNSSMKRILDLLVLYTFENGALTCAATIVSMICWLAMPTNLIFMGLHFVISKFYANSLLATLHAKKHLQFVHTQAQRGPSDLVQFTEVSSSRRPLRLGIGKPVTLQITVEESMIRTVDSAIPKLPIAHRQNGVNNC